MKISKFLRRSLLTFANRLMSSRSPDYVIGGTDRPYILRWYVIPRNKLFNIYLHQVCRSDDDRALHDHPWVNLSVILDSGYLEVLPNDKMLQRSAGDIVFRMPKALHRLVIGDYCKPVISLFMTGPNIRNWGFQCGDRWVPWQEFVDESDKGNIGKGCG